MKNQLALALAVAIGGAMGSLLRYFSVITIEQTVVSHFPWGVVFVNLFGSLLMGILVGSFLGHPEQNQLWRALLAVGVLGGFTTFSSFSLDLVKLIDRGSYGAALGYCSLSVVGGLVGLLLGRSIGGLFYRWFVV
ncbi:MAG: fluoride efflux transporter CrcB [Candidatus Pacebacteria bacterium]|nr:fluoride efflux transporter CrcB [Candidatus Paceibacterota bacterium]